MLRQKTRLARATDHSCGPPGGPFQHCLGFCSMSSQALKTHDIIILCTTEEIFDWLLDLQPSTKDKGLGRAWTIPTLSFQMRPETQTGGKEGTLKRSDVQ